MEKSSNRNHIFQTKETVSQEIFGARNIRVGVEYASKQTGFISRETGVDADGTWVIVVHWETIWQIRSLNAKMDDRKFC